MARTEKFTPPQIVEALQKSRGLQAVAARALKVDRKTISNYIEKYPQIKAAYEETNETNIDKAEDMLMGEIDKGNITAIIFYLKTKAKHRGYVERSEMTGKDGAPLESPKVIEIIKSEKKE